MPTKKTTGVMYKIQTSSIHGWADLKVSIGDQYVTEVFATKSAARAELKEILEDTDAESGDYRIVPATTKSEADIYD